MAQFIVINKLRFLQSLIGIAIWTNTIHAYADALRDPTLPADRAATIACSNLQSGPVLQSVMRGKHMNAALISGELIQLGQQYHGAKLIKMNETNVVLRESAGNIRTLSMQLPSTSKHASSQTSFEQKCQ